MPKRKTDDRPTRPLTPKQARFVSEYLVDLNATQAAIRAGYSASRAEITGSDLVRNRRVAAVIAERQQIRAETVGIDAAYVLRQAVKLHERCMQEIEPKTDRKGDPIVDTEGRQVFEFDALAAARALELVGKHVNIQAFRDQVGHGDKNGNPLVFQVVTGVPSGG